MFPRGFLNVPADQYRPDYFSTVTPACTFPLQASPFLHIPLLFLVVHLSLSPSLTLSLQEMKICSAIINLFHLIPAAPQTLVKPLLEVVMKTERAMLIEVGPECLSVCVPQWATRYLEWS